MKVQNARYLKKIPVSTVTHVVSVLILMLFSWPVLAQNDEDESTDPVAGLDLFDEDVESTRKGWPQLYVSAGIMYLDADGIFSARLPNGNTVTIIDFDRAGLKETDYSYWLSVNWRSPNSRWGAWFGSWRYKVDGSRVWEDRLELPDGNEIPVGASVTSDFDAQWYILEATYSFYQIGDREAEVVSGNLDTLAPLPNVLAYVSWKFAPRWMLTARVGYFTLDYDKYSGDMTNAHCMVSYSMSPRWALGAGYQFVDLDLAVDKTDFVQIYDIDFAGPMAYARFRF